MTPAAWSSDRVAKRRLVSARLTVSFTLPVSVNLNAFDNKFFSTCSTR